LAYQPAWYVLWLKAPLSEKFDAEESLNVKALELEKLSLPEPELLMPVLLTELLVRPVLLSPALPVPASVWAEVTLSEKLPLWLVLST
jgi:hypothetical protein